MEEKCYWVKCNFDWNHDLWRYFVGCCGDMQKELPKDMKCPHCSKRIEYDLKILQDEKPIPTFRPMTCKEVMTLIDEKNPWFRFIEHKTGTYYKAFGIGYECIYFGVKFYGYSFKEFEYLDGSEWKKLEVEVKNNA